MYIEITEGTHIVWEGEVKVVPRTQEFIQVPLATLEGTRNQQYLVIGVQHAISHLGHEVTIEVKAENEW